jgi:hypothetical protein
MTSMRLNPPPNWPPMPPSWAPPPGWQPDPSWPDPPPGWNLWLEDTAVTRSTASDAQVHAARWTMVGGGVAFFGSLLPFLSSPDPYLYPVSPAPAEWAAFFGITLAVLGILMLAKTSRTRLLSGVAAFVLAGLAVLTLGAFILAGIVGTSDDSIGTVHFSPQIGIFIAVLGCAVAGISALMPFAHGQRPERPAS